LDLKSIVLYGAILYFFGNDIVSFVRSITDTAVGTAKSAIGGISGGLQSHEAYIYDTADVDVASGGDLANCIMSCTNNFVGGVTSGIHIPDIHIPDIHIGSGGSSGQCTSMSCNNGQCTTSHECNTRIENTNSQAKSDIKNAMAKAYLSEMYDTGEHAMNRMTLM
jgi:hypothetical protein